MRVVERKEGAIEISSEKTVHVGAPDVLRLPCGSVYV